MVAKRCRMTEIPWRGWDAKLHIQLWLWRLKSELLQSQYRVPFFCWQIESDQMPNNQTAAAIIYLGKFYHYLTVTEPWNHGEQGKSFPNGRKVQIYIKPIVIALFPLLRDAPRFDRPQVCRPHCAGAGEPRSVVLQSSQSWFTSVGQ